MAGAPEWGKAGGEYKPQVLHSFMNNVLMCTVSSPLINLIQSKGLKDGILEL